jgi:hypothetical protein
MPLRISADLQSDIGGSTPPVFSLEKIFGYIVELASVK